jgi:sn1-specific diacylglycerol lipase
MNVLGTLWMFCQTINCFSLDDNFSNMIIEGNLKKIVVLDFGKIIKIFSTYSIGSILFYWIILGLKIFGIIVVYDPMGAKKYRQLVDNNDNIDPKEHHINLHRKLTKLWLRRFKFAFCCLTKDEYGEEAFEQSAELFSHLFRGIDLTPTDVLAGAILLRVREKKENRELRRIQTLNNICPRYSSDLSRIFNTQCPSWMTLRNAQHFLKFAVSSYGWQMSCLFAPCTSLYGILKRVKCCAKYRKKERNISIEEDNCCHCNVAGARFNAKIHNDDVIYASFRNKVYEVSELLFIHHSLKTHFHEISNYLQHLVNREFCRQSYDDLHQIDLKVVICLFYFQGDFF